MNKTLQFMINSGDYSATPLWAHERNELKMSKTNTLWKSFHAPSSISAAHTASLFFGVGDPGDDHYDELSWLQARNAAEATYSAYAYEREQLQTQIPRVQNITNPPVHDGIMPIQSCTKVDLDAVLRERRSLSTPRDGTLKNPGPNYERLSPQIQEMLNRRKAKNSNSFRI